MKAVWFGCGWVVGLTTVSIAFGAIPRSQRITDDSALYQRVSEIQVAKASQPRFDSELKRLSELEGRYQESPLLKEPLKRIEKRPYKKTSTRLSNGNRSRSKRL